MPVTFYGTYYTVSEVMRPLGRTYSIGCRYIKRIGLKPIRIGNKLMLNEEEKKAIEDFADLMDARENTYTLLEAAKKEVLGVPHKALEKAVFAGDIPSVKDPMGKVRLEEETIHILQNSKLLRGKRTKWGEVAKLFQTDEV